MSVFLFSEMKVKVCAKNNCMSERELNYCQSIEQLNGELMLMSLVRYSFAARE